MNEREKRGRGEGKRGNGAETNKEQEVETRGASNTCIGLSLRMIKYKSDCTQKKKKTYTGAVFSYALHAVSQ